MQSGSRLSSPVQLGVLLPTRGVLLAENGPPDASLLWSMAQKAEQAGFHSVWVGDSITAAPRLEALATLGALARCTSRLKLGTAVLLAALRHPLLLAHAVASLDLISEGRIILGVGAGRGGTPILAQEFENCGIPFGERGERLSEVLQICRRLWAETPVTYRGRYYHIADVALEPRPLQPGGPPLWISSNVTKRGLRRVGMLGDAWITNVTTPEVYQQCWEQVAAAAQAAGRDPEQIHRCLYLTVNIHANGEVARRQGRSFLEAYYRKPAAEVEQEMVCEFGNPAEVLARLDGYVRLGAQTVILRFASPDQVEQIEICSADVLPRL